jgi:hypothetical protein
MPSGAGVRPRRLVLAAAALVLASAGIAALALLLRPPVLIVTDVPFAFLYGPSRIRLRQIEASLALFRLVKPVLIAADAGEDMLPFAVEEVSGRPYCVLFPRRFVRGALLYREQFPEIPVVLMEDRTGSSREGGDNAAGFVAAATDSELDFYRAGLCAAILDQGKNGKIVLFLDESIQTNMRNAFIRGLRARGNETPPFFFTPFSRFSDLENISCVVLAGSGVEYLENNPSFPVILFSWLNPSLTSHETVVVFDDSPWAQAVEAVRIVEENRTGGRIPSKPLIFSAKVADNGILRELRKAAASL